MQDLFHRLLPLKDYTKHTANSIHIKKIVSVAQVCPLHALIQQEMEKLKHFYLQPIKTATRHFDGLVFAQPSGSVPTAC